MNRSSSFVSSLKWWPLQGHNNQSNSNSSSGSSSSAITAAHSAPATPTSNWPNAGSNSASGNHTTHNKTVTFGSSVAVQKLRESKWFKADEQRIFCAVVECGFIVEVRSSSSSAAVNATATSTSVSDSNSSISCFMGDQDENETPVTSWYGIVLCKTAKDNKPKPETIEIFSVKIRANGTYKMIKMALADIWKHGWELRINNFADKEKLPHNEKDIRSQVSLARKAKQSLWNNNQHFAYWCRYGSRQQDVRRRQMSECVRWGSAGMNAGMLLVLKKQHNNNNNNHTH